MVSQLKKMVLKILLMKNKNHIEIKLNDIMLGQKVLGDFLVTV